MRSDDTQRELEQRALRNVRGLVDKVEDQERADKHAERRMLKWFALLAVVLAAGVALYLTYVAGQRAGTTVIIEPKR